MSSLNEILSKIAGNGEEPEEAAEPTVDLIDPIYVEKLASAVEYMLENDLDEQDGDGVEKTANMKKLKEALAKGMSPKAAAKAAYPDYSDEQIAALLKQLGMGEKTASVDDTKKARLLGAIKTAMASKNAEVAEPVSEIRSSLQEKIASIEESKVRTDSEFIDSIVSRLNEVSALDTEVTAVEPEEEKTAEPEETVAEVVESAETEDEDTAKVANKLSLAEMLKNAAAGKTEVISESAPGEGAETAAGQSESISSLLRNSVLKRVNRVEV